MDLTAFTLKKVRRPPQRGEASQIAGALRPAVHRLIGARTDVQSAFLSSAAERTPDDGVGPMPLPTLGDRGQLQHAKDIADRIFGRLLLRFASAITRASVMTTPMFYTRKPRPPLRSRGFSYI